MILDPFQTPPSRVLMDELVGALLIIIILQPYPIPDAQRQHLREISAGQRGRHQRPTAQDLYLEHGLFLRRYCRPRRPDPQRFPKPPTAFQHDSGADRNHTSELVGANACCQWGQGNRASGFQKRRLRQNTSID